jgi:glycosyltransferase involved in cell wall biosynthesis
VRIRPYRVEIEVVEEALMGDGEKITIAFINLYTEMGGGEYAIYNLVRGLDKARFRPIVVFNKEGQFPNLVRELGVEVAILDYPTVMLQDIVRPAVFAAVRRGAKAIARFIEEQGVRIVHTVDVLGLLLLRSAVRRRPVPVLYNVIFFYEFARIVAFNVLGFALVNRIVTNSKAIRVDLLSRTKFLAERTTTIYYGIDTDRFRTKTPGEPNRLREELRIPPGKKLVGMVARFDTWKGHLTFLHAAAILLKKDPNIHFVVVGGLHNVDVIRPLRAYYDNVMQTWKTLGLEKQMTFIAHRDDVPELLRSLDVFVCPSEREPIPLIMFEAMASGVPIVAADSGGIPEQIDDGREGYLFKTGDPAHLAETIEKCLRPGSEALAAAARKKVVEKFHVSRFVREMEQEYEHLLAPEGTR